MRRFRQTYNSSPRGLRNVDLPKDARQPGQIDLFEPPHLATLQHVGGGEPRSAGDKCRQCTSARHEAIEELARALRPRARVELQQALVTDRICGE